MLIGRQILALCFTLLATLALGAPAQAQAIPWRVGHWNPDSFGNQRVVVDVADTGAFGAVRALIAWRRRDAQPELKRLLVTDASGRRVDHVTAESIRRDSGSVVFEPIAGPGDYYVYYLPYTGSVRSNYPRITYLGPEKPPTDPTAAAEWTRSLAAWIRQRTFRLAGDTTRQRQLPLATVLAFEAIDSMSNRWPMEATAMPSEVAAIRARIPAGNALAPFVEDRTRPIKMNDQLPEIWAERQGWSTTLGPAMRDEYYAFQVGVWAQQSLDSVSATFAPFSASGSVLPRTAFDCITTDGVDWLGRPLHRRVTVAADHVGALWCGVMIPRSAPAGDYRGTVTVHAAGGKSVAVPLTIAVTATVAVDHGDDEPWRLSRLRWLNSQLAADGAPTPPYTPIRRVPGGFAILGRQITFDSLGLPRQIFSQFTRDLAIGGHLHPLLHAPLALDIEGADGAVGRWRQSGVQVDRVAPSRATFHAHGRQGALDLAVRGTLDFDGNLEYQLALVTRRDTAVRTVRLVMQLSNRFLYFMGMNQRGGQIGTNVPAAFTWKWDVTKNQDAFWAGDVDGGLQFTFKDDRYVRPLNTNFYQQSPLRMPRSWANGGHGSCAFDAGETAYRATCGSGPITLVANDTLWFDFRILVTPFHPIDTKTHFDTRYYHAYKPVDTIRAAGANLVNIHHATAINPFINYPFLRPAEMKGYADSLHAAGMRMKIYYTVRELTDHAPELWALRSLDTEVLSDGPGGGYSWLQEHVADHYLGGWVVPQLRDAALVTSGISRWHNFYVEGMQWLTEHAGVDGIYLDDVAFDRNTMLRIRRVLAAHGGPGERIDLHSANQYDRNDGFASSANLYLEHFPFIDRLWFGEGFNYDSPPDYWLVEMSGIPFGLMGEMLEGGGNPWRGMLFGMTNRLPWTGSDPRALWKAWDDFGISGATMRGWWTLQDAPVQTGAHDVLATTYVRPGRALVAIASWAKDTVNVRLSTNWRALGLDSARVRLTAPEIPGFQSARTFKVGDAIPVAPGRGWLLRLDTFDARASAR